MDYVSNLGTGTPPDNTAYKKLIGTYRGKPVYKPHQHQHQHTIPVEFKQIPGTDDINAIVASKLRCPCGDEVER